MSKAGESGASGKRRRTRFGVRHMMFAVVVAALSIWVLKDYGRFLLVFGITVSPVLLICGAVVAILKQQATRQEAFLSVLAIAAENRLPIAPGSEAFADLCSGGFRRRALAFSYLLDSGVPLPQALASVPALLPPGSIALAGAGWDQGAFAAGLREAQRSLEARKAYVPAILGKLAYLVALLLVLQGIGAFILYFIAPKLQAIFADFGVPLPSLTRMVFGFGDDLFNSMLVPILLFVELAILIYLPFAFLGLVPRRLPLMSWLLRRRDDVTVLRGAAITVESGQPIGTGLRALADHYPVSRVSRNLRNASQLIEAGMPWTEALQRRGFIGHNEVAMLESAERAGNLAWALRTIAEGYERRLGFRLTALSQFLLPAIVLLMGAAVGLVTIAYFLPLVELIQRLAET